VLSLDNAAIDVRVAWIDADADDPASLTSVLDDAASVRPPNAPCAVVVPLIAAPHGRVMRTIRDAISDKNAAIGEFVNANPLLAEALHIRLAEAGLARADRVRLFSIVTAADGLVVATVGGAEALQSASITSFLLSARLAIPVLTASLDGGSPSIEEAALRLKEMGASRIAVAPCVIGPELVAAGISLDELIGGGECSRPLGVHGNVTKLITTAYGQAISELEPAPEEA
jgi:sirohydrochlorin ferrochelatase